MGFTPAEYGSTPEALDETYRFIQENGDLIAHHFDEGIPWPEALEQKPYHPNVEKNLRLRAQKTKPGQKVYVALTPYRERGLLYWGEESQMPVPEKWRGKNLGDPEVIVAYTNFCRDMIKRFHPDFVAYGIEVNWPDNRKFQWPEFAVLAKAVYTQLKAENPGLPLFFSIQIDEFWKHAESQRKGLALVLPYTDFIAVSTYRYLDNANPREIPKDFFSGVAALAPNKPFAVAETGFIAEDMEALGKRVRGREKWQNDYVKFLLSESQKLKAKMVIWFVSRDYDLFFENLKRLGVSREILEIFRVFRDTGLVDGAGRKRAAFRTWSEWLKAPLE